MIKTKEDNLFKKWKSENFYDSGAIFVTDGIVNEEVWNNANPKILYLLKEVNGAKEEWDERDYLSKYNTQQKYINTHSPTINVLIKWQYGIVYGMGQTWSDVERETAKAEIQTELLSQICLVNIKKTAGGAATDCNQFDLYFSKEINRINLKEQLSFYEPNIVICGGTAWHLCQIKDWNYSDWDQTCRGIRYRKERDTLYIEFCHPNNRGPKNMIYYGLMDAIEEISRAL